MEEKKSEVGFGKRAVVSYDGFDVVGVILEIDAAKKTDMVFHRLYGKLLYLLSGKIKVIVLSDGIMNSLMVNAGSSFYIRPGLVYQIEAVEKAIAVEFELKDALQDVSCIAKGTPVAKIEQSIPAPTPVVATTPAPQVPVVPQPVMKEEEKPQEEPKGKKVAKKKPSKKNKKLN